MLFSRKLRALIFGIWFRCGGWPIVISWDEVRFRLRKQHYQLRSLIRFGPEPFLQNLLLMSADGAVFIDIGANIGVASLAMARKVKWIIAFEPTRNAFEDLKFNASLNEFSNISSVPAAISSSSGVMAMRAEPWWGHNSIIADAAQSLGKPVVNVPVLTLDSLLPFVVETCEGFGFEDRVLIKVDVEGHELEVFRGGSELLSKLDNVIICFEAWDETYSQPCISHLERLGYEVFSPPIDTKDQDVFMRKIRAGLS